MNHLEFARAWLHVKLRSERGASLVEYALLIALIALVCYGAVTMLGENTAGQYSEMGESFRNM